MAKFEITETQQPYIKALKEMMAIGQSAWTPDENDALINLIEADPGKPKRADLLSRRAAIIDILRTAFANHPDQAAANVYRALLGFEPWTNKKRDDRHKFVTESIMGKGFVYDWNTQYSKEPLNRDLKSILVLLETNIYVDQKGRRPVDVIAPNGYELMSYHIFYDLASGERVTRRRLRAVRDSVAYWEQSFRTYGRQPDELQLMGPGRLTRHSEGEILMHKATGTSYMLRIDFAQPLREGDEFEFTLVGHESVDVEATTAPGWISERDQVPSLTIGLVTFEVRLPDVGRLPARCWRYENLAPWLTPGSPARSDLLAPDTDRTVRWSWKQPPVGRACGLAWEW